MWLPLRGALVHFLHGARAEALPTARPQGGAVCGPPADISPLVNTRVWSGRSDVRNELRVGPAVAERDLSARDSAALLLF